MHLACGNHHAVFVFPRCLIIIGQVIGCQFNDRKNLNLGPFGFINTFMNSSHQKGLKERGGGWAGESEREREREDGREGERKRGGGAQRETETDRQTQTDRHRQ